jgi:hypothetical protein
MLLIGGERQNLHSHMTALLLIDISRSAEYIHACMYLCAPASAALFSCILFPDNLINLCANFYAASTSPSLRSFMPRFDRTKASTVNLHITFRVGRHIAAHVCTLRFLIKTYLWCGRCEQPFKSFFLKVPSRVAPRWPQRCAMACHCIHALG